MFERSIYRPIHHWKTAKIPFITLLLFRSKLILIIFPFPLPQPDYFHTLRQLIHIETQNRFLTSVESQRINDESPVVHSQRYLLLSRRMQYRERILLGLFRPRKIAGNIVLLNHINIHRPSVQHHIRSKLGGSIRCINRLTEQISRRISKLIIRQLIQMKQLVPMLIIQCGRMQIPFLLHRIGSTLLARTGCTPVIG